MILECTEIDSILKKIVFYELTIFIYALCNGQMRIEKLKRNILKPKVIGIENLMIANLAKEKHLFRLLFRQSVQPGPKKMLTH